MFHEIISISKGFAIVRVDNNISDDILNYNVIFEDGTKKILGEIEEIVNNNAKINFIGEFYDNHYYNGIIMRVENELPTMKHDDMRLLCYLIANFSSVSICLFLGISIDNVYTRKRRLKSKIASLNEPLRGDLLAFLA